LLRRWKPPAAVADRLRRCAPRCDHVPSLRARS
jgi:hypothetical protein